MDCVLAGDHRHGRQTLVQHLYLSALLSSRPLTAEDLVLSLPASLRSLFDFARSPQAEDG